jgi:phosphatidylserine/phosphatidylglycerophosphate/cardiolipin synthase-like enzyme
MTRSSALGLLSFTLLAACVAEPGTAEEDAGEIPYAEGSREGQAVLIVANDKKLGVAELDGEAGVALSSRAAENIVKHRDGADAGSTADDNPFDSLAELYSVPYCKRTCMELLLDYAKRTGVYDSLGNTGVRVVFSPQQTANSHLAEVAKLIDGAQSSVDIAMYSYSHQDPIKGALQRALSRGVKVRFLADTDLAVATAKGGALEGIGIDVRRVTKIMHHKFAIIDGPRDDASLSMASTAKIVTGSGNWSSSAATIYDENTLFFNGYPELALRLQRDFDTLWAGSKDQVFNTSFTWDKTRANITDALIAEHEDDNTHVWFTSKNFKATGSGGWSVLGTTEVTDKLVEAVNAAETSIHIASGHFLSTALVTAIANAAKRGVEVDIVLDCQEVSNSGGAIGSGKRTIESNGGSILYKCNTYRWHHTFAKQMHHKYMVIDGEELYTGSLNFSDNAETNTFENMLLLKGEQHMPVIQAYLDNHATVKNYGRANDLAALEDLRDDIANGSSVPLTWDTALSLDYDTYQDLKRLIREECPATNSYADTPESKTYNKLFTKSPQWFSRCQKSGYPWPNVPVDQRVQ